MGFLDRLSEKNRGLPLTDYGAPAESFKAGLKNAKDYLVNRISLSPDAKRFIKTRLLKSWDAYQPQALPVRCINEMFVNCTALSEYFDRAEVEKMLGWCSRLQFEPPFLPDGGPLKKCSTIVPPWNFIWTNRGAVSPARADPIICSGPEPSVGKARGLTANRPEGLDQKDWS